MRKRPREEKPEIEYELVSKTEMKRIVTELQVLGEKLVALPERELQRIPIDEQLLEQIHIAQKIKHKEGRRRQLQFIGKLMRKLDCDPIAAAIQELEDGHKKLSREFHRLEQWRDELVVEGDPAITRFLAEYPAADRQHLRQLIRTAQKEASQEKPPAHKRKLFRYIRELYEAKTGEE